MNRVRWLLFALTAIAACAGKGLRTDYTQSSADCPRQPASDAIATDSVSLQRLVGRSRLVMIDTVNRQLSPWMRQVNLQPPDSAFLALLGEVNRGLGRVPPSGRPTPPLVEFHPGSAIWMAHQFGISVGECLGILCSDSSPTYYEFRFLSPTVVRGIWWNNMTGIGVLTDPNTGRFLPPPAGVFCMIPV
jgi:hypothetical protein